MNLLKGLYRFFFAFFPRRGALLFVLFLVAGCEKGASGSDPLWSTLLLLGGASDGGYAWVLPTGFPVPAVPADNPMSESKVRLGRFLFYDKRLSRDSSKSCATCHIQSRAFTDGLSRAVGLDANTNGIVDASEIHLRNAQHLSNVAYLARYTWASSIVRTLEDQAQGPLFQTGAPIPEMGLTTEIYKEEALDRLRAQGRYEELFTAAFGSSTINFDRVLKAIASFERTLISGDSSFDRYYYQGDSSGMSTKALDGAILFFGEKAECFHCHGGFNFTDTNLHDQTVFEEVFFHTNGLYRDSEYAGMTDTGLEGVTGDTAHRGRFRAPSLRNVALTYPYMHDGSIQCTGFTEGAPWDESCAREALARVVEHYAAGGRCYDGSANLLDCSSLDTSLIRPISLSAYEREALVEFLLTLTDTGFVNNPAFANPDPSDPLLGE